LLRAALIFGGGGFLVKLAAKKCGGVRKPELAFFIFIVWSCLTLIWTQTSRQSLALALDLFGVLCCFIMLSVNTKSLKKCEQYGWFYVVGCCISSVLVLRNWFAGADFEGSARFSSSEYINPNYVAYSMAGGFSLICFFISKFSLCKIIKIAILFFMLGLLIFSVFLTGSRGAVISCLISAFAAINFRKTSHARNKFLLNILVLTLVSLAVLFAPVGFFSRFVVENYDEGGAGYSTGRFEMWSAAWSNAQNLFIGHGYDSFGYITKADVNPHNIFISVGFEMGVIGLISYLATLFFLKQSAGSFYPNKGFSRELFLIVVLGWLPIALTGVWGLSPVAWLIFSWVHAMSRSYNAALRRGLCE
jgi:O-antigen ligase